ncbi:hypothetical protein [Alicyclobacillus fodiniaquatilis]|uniref:SinR family protein n=1 Tax=Alicyclobacillus fodiniaquatilis TaxID=1661150 RepID=A0ABW4JC81_9BACL
MAILCVSYDLHKATEEDYKPLIEHLKTYKTWWHHLDSTWFIKTDISAEDVLKRCVESIPGKGSIIVFDVGNMWAASGFKDRAYQWLWENWPEE